MAFSMTMTACGSNNGNAVNTPKNATENAEGNTTEPAVEPVADEGTDISGEITFLTNRTDMIGKEYDEYVKRFNEKYPNIKVEFEASQTDYNQQAKVRMASGELPDVMFIPTIPNSDLPKYFASLDDLGLNDQITFKDLRSFEGKLTELQVVTQHPGSYITKKHSQMPASPKFQKHGMSSLLPAKN